MKRIRLTILFMFFCVLSFSQSIDIVSFNTSTDYCAGSGVSVHMNPSGIFTLENTANLQDSANNSFVLEISGPGGDWSNPTTLNTVYDFYTPIINGTLPADLASGSYLLRVRSTQPAITSTSTSSFENSPFLLGGMFSKKVEFPPTDLSYISKTSSALLTF